MKFQKVIRLTAIGGFWLALFSMTMEAKTKVTNQPFGKMPDGTPVEIYTLGDGVDEARIMTYGGVVVSLKAPDRKGKPADVVLGFDNVGRVLRSHHRPLCESHCPRQLYSGWREVFAAPERWHKLSSWRAAWLQQRGLEGKVDRRWSRTHLS